MIFYHDGRPSPWPNHPLRFATHQVNCTSITTIPLTTLCRSFKVSKYHLIFFCKYLSLTIARVRFDIMTASRQHPMWVEPSTFTTPNPPGVLNTLMARGRSDMGVRYGVYQHVLLDVFDSPANCSNLATFCGTDHNTTHSNTQPVQHLRRPNTHPRRGDAATAR